MKPAAGQDRPLSGSLPVAGRGALDLQNPGAPFAVVGAVGEVVEDLVLRSVDGDGARHVASVAQPFFCLGFLAGSCSA
jgi:hypothetical protein